jgi:hypothetical protein
MMRSLTSSRVAAAVPIEEAQAAVAPARVRASRVASLPKPGAGVVRGGQAKSPTELPLCLAVAGSTADLEAAAGQPRRTYVGKRAAKGSSGNRKAFVI